MEDWDALFDAVIVRLRASVASWNQAAPLERRESWKHTRAHVLECVDALDQLHSSATHTFALQKLEALEAFVLRPKAPPRGDGAVTPQPLPSTEPAQSAWVPVPAAAASPPPTGAPP